MNSSGNLEILTGTGRLGNFVGNLLQFSDIAEKKNGTLNKICISLG